MRLAFLGATSQIARDLVAHMMPGPHELALYARSPQRVHDWLAVCGGTGRCDVAPIADFEHAAAFDAVINFVGVSDPARAAAMGATIMEVTRRHDDMVLAHLARHPACRYLFLSSGAVYGGSFDAPVDDTSVATLPVNDIRPHHWYGIAKLAAECVHRCLPEHAIVDLRVFSYFSRNQDLAGRLLMADAMRAILAGTVLRTSDDVAVRDYIHPSDLHRLVEVVLAAPRMNTALDVCSQAPIDKRPLLAALRDAFGLRYESTPAAASVNATGAKRHYHSLSRRAAALGWAPEHDSLAGILLEAQALLAAHAGGQA